MNSDFYKSQRWLRKRAATLRRDMYMCQECRKYGRTEAATIVHHKKDVETHPGLALKDDNLVSLCAKCHNKMHQEKGGYRY